MLSDIGFTFARHTIVTFQLLGMGALLLGIAAFVLTFSRERTTALRPIVPCSESGS